MTQRVIKGFGGLSGKRAAGRIGNGAGDHQRQVNAQRLQLLFHRIDGRFGIQGIKYRFNQDQIHATFHQRPGGFAIGGHQLVKGNITERRIVHIRRNRGGTVGRAKHARDVARFFRRAGRPGVGAGAGQLRRGKVDLGRQGFHLVIRHRDGRRVKGVGLNDIRTGLEVGVVDLADHLGLAEHQQVVVAFQVARPVSKALTAKVLLTQTIALDHGAHAPIQNQNTFF